MSSSNKHELAEIDDGDNDNITQLIPDLEDEQEDMARQVAEAPHLTKSRVMPIKVFASCSPDAWCPRAWSSNTTALSRGPALIPARRNLLVITPVAA